MKKFISVYDVEDNVFVYINIDKIISFRDITSHDAFTKCVSVIKTIDGTLYFVNDTRSELIEKITIAQNNKKRKK